MAIGNGPIVILKETGLTYTFSSAHSHMFGYGQTRTGVNKATSLEEFQIALDDLVKRQDQAALSPEQLGP